MLLLCGIVITACGGQNQSEETSRTNEQILAEISEVQAIGKVAPADDWAIISSPVAARIQHILVAAGDTVAQGQPLLLLEPGNAALDIAEAEARLASVQADNRSTLEELGKAQVQATELKAIYETSQLLLEKGAETREKTASDLSNWKQQERVINSLEQQLHAQRASEKEQTILLQKVQNQLADFSIPSPQSGIVTDLNIRVGQYINGSEELGRIANTSRPIIDAEIDELFADDVRVGQSVHILTVGRGDTLARGHVSYTSPVLSDKSILYETANEGEDRRVRRIKVTPDGPVSLIINAKVTCAIKVR